MLYFGRRYVAQGATIWPRIRIHGEISEGWCQRLDITCSKLGAKSQMPRGLQYGQGLEYMEGCVSGNSNFRNIETFVWDLLLAWHRHAGTRNLGFTSHSKDKAIEAK
jgi:hypothetical protein